MSIWKTTSIYETPEVKLSDWKIYEVESESSPKKTKHFVGYNLTEREGRVSSHIVEFDPKTMTGRTKSGRVYKLVGNSGTSSDGSYVWSRWCTINEVTSVEEVHFENF